MRKITLLDPTLSSLSHMHSYLSCVDEYLVDDGNGWNTKSLSSISSTSSNILRMESSSRDMDELLLLVADVVVVLASTLNDEMDGNERRTLLL